MGGSNSAALANVIADAKETQRATRSIANPRMLLLYHGARRISEKTHAAQQVGHRQERACARWPCCEAGDAITRTIITLPEELAPIL